ICILAALGFGALVLVGPIIAVFLFASIGMAIYLLLRVAYSGREPAKRAVKNLATGARSTAYVMTCWARSQVRRGIDSMPGRYKEKPGHPTAPVAEVTGKRLSFWGKLLLETLSGAAVGALLAAALFIYIDQAGKDLKEVIAIGAGIGG